MSGIYIKGMEMPKDYSVIVKIFPDGRVGTISYVQLFKVDLIPGAQAVPVPPHGDLIDRDALEQDAQKRLLMCDKNDNQFQKPYEVMRAIALAPAIIEAEGE